MGTRTVLQTFEKYQRERVAFVSAVAEMARSPQAGRLQDMMVQQICRVLQSKSFRLC